MVITSIVTYRFSNIIFSRVTDANIFRQPCVYEKKVWKCTNKLDEEKEGRDSQNVKINQMFLSVLEGLVVFFFFPNLYSNQTL